MATTHDGTALAQFSTAMPAYVAAGSGPGFGILTLHIDMEQIADQLGATVDGSASDVLQLWDIPAGTTIFPGAVHVIRAEGAACTITGGIGGAATAWLQSTSIAATGWTTCSSTWAATTAFGYFFAATDTFDIVFGTAADVDYAIFDIYIPCLIIKPIDTIYTVGPDAGT